MPEQKSLPREESVPPVIGNMGQDDAFATESHPEGLPYGRRPARPGELPHPQVKDIPDEPPLSVGDATG